MSRIEDALVSSRSSSDTHDQDSSRIHYMNSSSIRDTNLLSIRRIPPRLDDSLPTIESTGYEIARKISRKDSRRRKRDRIRKEESAASKSLSAKRSVLLKSSWAHAGLTDLRSSQQERRPTPIASELLPRRDFDPRGDTSAQPAESSSNTERRGLSIHAYEFEGRRRKDQALRKHEEQTWKRKEAPAAWKSSSPEHLEPPKGPPADSVPTESRGTKLSSFLRSFFP